MPDVRTCPTCAGIARFSRKQHHADEQAMKHLGERPDAQWPSDGRKTSLRAATPDEIKQVRDKQKAVTRGSPQ